MLGFPKYFWNTSWYLKVFNTIKMLQGPNNFERLKKRRKNLLFCLILQNVGSANLGNAHI